MPDLSDRRSAASTALAALPAVRAAERAIVTKSVHVLADTLAAPTAAEARRRLRHVLDLKERAERDAASRDASLRAADELRSWAARVYLAALQMPRDPIERWEWEGGAIAADVRSASDEAAASDQPSSSTTSSRRRPPGASASTTSPTRRPSRAAPIGDSCEISPAVGSLSPVPTTR